MSSAEQTPTAELPPEQAPEPGALASALRTAAIMLVFTLIFTGVMAITYDATAPAIAGAAQQAKLSRINEILPPALYDNPLLDDVLELGPRPAPGLAPGGRAYRARKAGQPTAVVVEAEAPDGYSGRIAMAVAVSAEGRLLGVRVTSHRETPGLGDYIDPQKDKNKAEPWIKGFEGLSFAEVAAGRWTVKKDGGHFAYRTGATISARAVTVTVGKVMQWVADQGDALYAPPAR